MFFNVYRERRLDLELKEQFFSNPFFESAISFSQVPVAKNCRCPKADFMREKSLSIFSARRTIILNLKVEVNGFVVFFVMGWLSRNFASVTTCGASAALWLEQYRRTCLVSESVAFCGCGQDVADRTIVWRVWRLEVQYDLAFPLGLDKDLNFTEYISLNR